MGVLPLEFASDENAASLGLTGRETYAIRGIREALAGSGRAQVKAVGDDGFERIFQVAVRIDTPQELEYFRHGGILPYVLRQLAG
jgi:aconitate hydratase